MSALRIWLHSGVETLRYPDNHDAVAAETRRAWLAVSTQPHREMLAIENLRRQAYETYCPRLRKRVRHARKTQDVLRPMFPGYLFVRIDAERQRWRPINSTVGVRTIVSCGDGLSFLSEDFIAALQAREIDGAIARPQGEYQPGQKIRMAGGPFDGLVATILEMDEKERLTVLMDLLNSRIKVKIDARWCAAP
jgi:transcriptional antiterminator RfaH